MLRRLLLVLSVLLAAAPLSAQTAGASGIKFKGVMVQGEEVKVCLVNLSTNNAKWISVGGKFGGYIVKSCAAKVMNPYIVLAPPNGRGTETILRLEEIAAPVNALPVNGPLATRDISGGMPATATTNLNDAAVQASLEAARAAAQARADAARAAAPPPPPANQP
jgi:hypothetical protein